MQFYLNFALFSTLEEDEPRPRFFSEEQIKHRPKKKVFIKTGRFFPRIQVKTEFGENVPFLVKTKKKAFTKNGTFFFAGSSGDLRQSQIIEGDSDVDHTQVIGGDTVKLLRGIYPSRVSAPLLSINLITDTN